MAARRSRAGRTMMDLTRRDMLTLGATVVGTGVIELANPARAHAQTPKRGGVFRIRGEDPVSGLDPHIVVNHHRIATNLSFTHSRLVRIKSGAQVKPGTMPIEPDLAESWTQANDTTFVFKLRKGVRWHNKPPVNGRELTAEDVRYSVEHFLTIQGNANAYMLKTVERVEATDRYTVKFTLKEPFAWFPDMLATPMAVAIIARECVEKFGDLKKPEAFIGTGPWMLDNLRPGLGQTLVRHPGYFVPGLPYIDRVEQIVDEDSASRIAGFLAGKYDVGFDGGLIFRTEWVQIRDALKQKRPNLRTADVVTNIMSHLSMRTDRPPFNDLRVRQAMSLAVDRKDLMDATSEGT